MERPEEMTVEIYSHTCYEAFRVAYTALLTDKKQGPEPWTALPKSRQVSWRAGIGDMLRDFEDRFDGMTYVTAAENLLRSMTGKKEVKIASRTTSEQIALECSVRHLLNVYRMDPGEELEEHEQKWADWAQKKAALPKMETVPEDGESDADSD